MCVFIEGTMRMLCDHLNPCHGRVDWHISYHWYGNVYIQCHMLYILLHLRYVVSDDWFADVNLFIFLPLYFFPSPEIPYCTRQHGAIFTHSACNNCTSCKSRPVFYFAFCFSLFRTCQWTFLINFEAVAKCVSFNPTVDTQMPCVHASCAYVYIVCKPVNIFDICGCEWNEPMYTVL